MDKIVQSAPSLGRGEVIEKINVDGMFLYGLRSAPKVYNVLADALEWITHHCQQHTPIHNTCMLTTRRPTGTRKAAWSNHIHSCAGYSDRCSQARAKIQVNGSSLIIYHASRECKLMSDVSGK